MSTPSERRREKLLQEKEKRLKKIVESSHGEVHHPSHSQTKPLRSEVRATETVAETPAHYPLLDAPMVIYIGIFFGLLRGILLQCTYASCAQVISYLPSSLIRTTASLSAILFARYITKYRSSGIKGLLGYLLVSIVLFWGLYQVIPVFVGRTAAKVSEDIVPLVIRLLDKIKGI
ncbi:hypothetical protein P9112_004264 [Eukaryota sp. TZLM1-RC]